MQAIVETLFDTAYLVSVITIGTLMIRESKNNTQFRLFGCMAVVLGAGDAFHLIPAPQPSAPRDWITTPQLWGWGNGSPLLQ